MNRLFVMVGLALVAVSSMAFTFRDAITTGSAWTVRNVEDIDAFFDRIDTAGFLSFTGPTTSTKTFTLPDASATILTTSAAVTVGQGGTGRATSTTAYGLLAAGTTATGAQQTLAAGATTEILVGAGASALPAWTTATGSGAPVRGTSPTLVTPALGTPSAIVLTNASGTAASLTAGTVTTNANLSGDVTSSGSNATTIAANSVQGTDISLASEAAGDVMYFNGTDWVRLAKGTAGQVLEMNAGATAPEWDTDDTAGGVETFSIETAVTTSDLRVKARAALTVTQLDCVATGSATPSAQVMTVMECDSAAANCATTGLTITANATATNYSDSTTSNATIDADDWWGLDTTSLTTAADIIHCTVRYTY